jgi:dipeptidase D
MEVKDLQPKEVFEIFDQITKIPRPSRKEEKIRKFILDFAKENGIEAHADKVGNVILRKPATPGYENAPTAILQGHMDMVCESDHPGFDFENSPIETIVDGEWVRANGTTLGADNGIGVAAALAILSDKTLVHGPLEALVTMDEETGMTGANGLEKGELKGTMLLNLDSEDDAEIFVGCAGGIDTIATFTYKRSCAPADCHYFNFDVRDGLGGHSGGDIHLGRANANKIVARFLYNLMQQQEEVVISEIDGGNLRNAIPRAAHVVFGVKAAHKEEVVAAFNQYAAAIENEYKGLEVTMKLTLNSVEKPEYTVDSETAKNVVLAVYSAPHGVQSWSRDMENLVESSTNLASVKMADNDKIVVTTSQRSCVDSRKFDIAHQVEALFTVAGATVEHSDGYPAWTPNLNSPIMKMAADAYEELFGIKPAIKGIHAGLECALFQQNYPELDMVSFGPTLRDVHSPSERMHIPAVDRFYKQLRLTLEKVAKSC